jgi:nitronate monooxygenase
MAYMGTRFIATQESDATDEYKEMILNATASEIVKSNKITGVNGNWLEQSLKNAGISTQDGGFKKTLSDIKRMIMPLIKQKLKVDFDISKVTAKRWRDIFSAGQGVGSISNVPSVEDLVIELEQQHDKSKSRIL